MPSMIIPCLSVMMALLRRQDFSPKVRFIRRNLPLTPQFHFRGLLLSSPTAFIYYGLQSFLFVWGGKSSPTTGAAKTYRAIARLYK
jgi:hypothetical protein